jgi:pyruvate/2-oxoglutarate dehydrogenase complex dihydrolipoamide dehydrogenase (E3) component
VDSPFPTTDTFETRIWYSGKQPLNTRAMPLDVVVVGAGIAGVCAAVALRQAGHSVRVRCAIASQSIDLLPVASKNHQ